MFGIHPNLYTQDCLIDEVFIINDNNSTTINIYVEGAVLNELSDPNQGLCEIHLAFEHGAVGQLDGTITAPDGTRIQLLGPAGVNNTSTQLIDWEISFVQEGLANPDLGLPPDWDNNFMIWPMFNSYSGSYHPYVGELGDFNSGMVNGLWTIQLNDVTSTQYGEITSISLVFCDDTGVMCNTCNTLSINDVETVVDSIDCNQGFGSVTYNSAENFIAFNWDGPNNFTSEFSSPLFLSPGIYYVTATADSGCTFVDTIFMDWQDGISDMVYQNIEFACGQSDGSFLQSGNFSAWTYFWTGPGLFTSEEPNPTITEIGYYHLMLTSLDGSCILELDLIATQGGGAIVDLISDGVIGCTKDMVTIEASTSTVLNSSVWYSDLNFTLIDDFHIYASEEGWYYFETVDEGGCGQTDSIFIEDISRDLDLNIPDAILVYNCNDNGVNLVAESNEFNVDFVWSDAQSVIILGQAPYVTEEGTYYVEIESLDGCIAMDSIEVVADTISPTVDFFVSSNGILSCLLDSVRLVAFPAHNAGFTFEWISPEPSIYIENEIWVKEEGTYYFNIYGDNGCNFSDSIQVTSSISDFEVSLPPTFTLDCSEETISISASSLEPNLNYIWEGSGIVTEMDETITVNEDGIYSVTAINNAGCSAEASTEVLLDENQPEITILVSDTLDCATNTITLSFQSNATIQNISWTGPEIGDQPTIEVMDAGSYTLEVEAINGCITFESIDVPIDTISPTVSVLSDTLDCSSSQVEISIDDLVENPFYSWEGPDVLVDNVAIQTVTNEGEYIVTITDLANGCSTIRTIQVIEDIGGPEIQLFAPNLPCDGGSIEISVDSDIAIVDYQWIGPTGPFESSTLQPLIEQTGLFEVMVTGTNGCVSKDSIEINLSSDLPDFMLAIGTITCTNLEAETCALDILDDLSVQWFDENEQEITSNDCFKTSVPGEYSVIVTGMNGCSLEQFFYNHF